MNKKPEYITEEAWASYLLKQVTWKQACSISSKYWWRLGLATKALEATKGVEHGCPSGDSESE